MACSSQTLMELHAEVPVIDPNHRIGKDDSCNIEIVLLGIGP